MRMRFGGVKVIAIVSVRFVPYMDIRRALCHFLYCAGHDSIMFMDLHWFPN
jgi:hypothetical protein